MATTIILFVRCLSELVHDGVWVAADNCAFALRLARYCAPRPSGVEPPSATHVGEEDGL